MTINVLISAYAVCPGKGSEPGLGWNWVSRLANLCNVHVITEREFKEQIEAFLPESKTKFQLKFYYIDIGERAREMCWNQGDWRFYLSYREWQVRALELAEEITQHTSFDIVHHLNMIGYREPGYLWRLNIPYVIGPIGGFSQFPFRYIGNIGFKQGLYQLVRNVINSIQMRTHRRLREALKAASIVYVATSTDYQAARNITNRAMRVLNETGAEQPTKMEGRQRSPREGVTLVWCGKNVSRKALTLAFDAMEALRFRNIEARLLVIGVDESGLSKVQRRKVARMAGSIELLGQLSRHDVLAKMNEADAMLFTSVMEGTPHVVLEALASGLPVLCHSTCGQGDVVTEDCGVLIPLSNWAASVAAFADAIERLNQHPELCVSLSRGALLRAQALSWEGKIEEVFGAYRKILDDSSYA